MRCRVRTLFAEKHFRSHERDLVYSITISLVEHSNLSGRQDGDVRIARITLHDRQAGAPGKASVQAVAEGQVTALLRIGGIDEEQAAVLTIVGIMDNSPVAAGIGQSGSRIRGP